MKRNMDSLKIMRRMRRFLRGQIVRMSLLLLLDRLSVAVFAMVEMQRHIK